MSPDEQHAPPNFDLLSFIAQRVVALDEKFDSKFDAMAEDVSEIRGDVASLKHQSADLARRTAELEQLESKREEAREKRRQEIEESSKARWAELGTKAVGLLAGIITIIVLVLQGGGGTP